jgi:hypothetical protein
LFWQGQNINFRPNCNCRADPKSPFGKRVLVMMPKLEDFCVADGFVAEYARLRVTSGGGRSERHITITAS